jgi:hypothetical protein
VNVRELSDQKKRVTINASPKRKDQMKLSSSVLAFALALLAWTAPAVAQKSSDSSTDVEKGFTATESFQSTLNSQERLFKLDSNLGWDFSKHFGVFAGVPVYFVNVPASTTTVGTTTTTTPSSSNNGIGNAYLGLALRAPNSKLDYASTITAGAPTGDTKKGLSTGRATIDWDNRFEHSFSRLTPFFDGGFGNTVPDSKLVTRAFTSLGFVAHLEEGAELELVKHFSVGGSGYQIVPEGNQKIYSKLVAKGGTGKPGSKNVFQTSATASGNGLTRENGFNTWVGLDAGRLWHVQVGYTRSTTFDLSSFAFNISMNLGKLLRSGKSS